VGTAGSVYTIWPSRDPKNMEMINMANIFFFIAAILVVIYLPGKVY
jgi:hypothetical protein